MKGPPFPIPAYQMHSNWEIALFLLLGLATAPVARAYIHTLYGSEHLGKRITWLPDWIKPALGGILFGTLGLLIPHTLGAGYDTITIALAGKVSLGVMALLLAGKFLAIGLTSGSGWPGGVFTPALFLGAMFGGTFGALMQLVLPGIVTQPGIFAVVGMAAMIAGATQAPLTAMALIFEVTQDYRIALPAMLACGVAAVFSQRFSPYSVDTLHLPEAGVLLPWEFHDLRAMRVAEVMRTDVHVVRDTMQLHDVINLMHQHHHGGYPVLSDDGKLVGLITLGDIRDVPLERRLVTPVADVMARDLAVVTPDESIADAARLMARRKVGRVPVVDAADSTRLVGILSRSDILRAYPADETQPTSPYGEEVETAFLER